MQFGLIRLIDQILGRILLFILAPFCFVIGAFMPSKPGGGQKTFSFIKMHGGGSLLIALPSLLGIRKKHPAVQFALVCTAETQKYAELTRLFNRYIVIDQRNLLTLVVSGIQALAQCVRHDVCVDLEPHSYLAGLFTVMTLSTRRLGFVKSNELFRARAYTDALFFNPFAPIYAFYDQMAGLLGAEPATVDECRKNLAAPSPPLAVPADTKKPIVFLSPFCSDFAQERMMPNELWPRLLKKHYGDQPITILIGGGHMDLPLSHDLNAILKRAFPATDIVNLCGKRTLAQSVEDIRGCDAFWGIDSGPLHIARLLGKPCFSFWGPTNPSHRLRAMPGLEETTGYLGFACSPCIDSVERAPCQGNNQCMKSLLEPPLRTPPITIKL